MSYPSPLLMKCIYGEKSFLGDRGAWWAMIHRISESDTTKVA